MRQTKDSRFLVLINLNLLWALFSWITPEKYSLRVLVGKSCIIVKEANSRKKNSYFQPTKRVFVRFSLMSTESVFSRLLDINDRLLKEKYIPLLLKLNKKENTAMNLKCFQRYCLFTTMDINFWKRWSWLVWD